MYYLDNVHQKSMAACLTRNDCEGFEEVLYIQWNGRDWWWCVVYSMGMLGVSVRRESDMLCVLSVWNL